MIILSSNNPSVLYNNCLQYIIIYQKKLNVLDKYLDQLIDYFNNELTNIINICIHDISNLNNRLIYIQYRNIYVKEFIKKIYLNYKYNINDSKLVKNNKYINSHILFNLYYNKIIQLKNYNDCIIFVDKILNIFDNLPHRKYIVKGNLIENNEIIYSNVCEEIIIDDDDISRLPPKKRYRKH